MSFFKRDELRLLWPFYVDALFLTILVLFPAFYIIYLIDIGLSLFQIGVLSSVLFVSGVLFEVPTGAVADIFGRKFSTILGLFLTGLTTISIFFFTSFYSLILLFFVWGSVGTLISGAKDAWIVDLVKSNKRDELVSEYYTKKHSFVSAGFLLSGVVGAFLVKQFGLSIIWPITGSASLLAAFIFLWVKEDFKKKKQHIKEHYKDLMKHTKESVKYSKNHTIISSILMVALVMALLIGFTGDMLWYPFLQELGFQEHWFGYFFSATSALGIFAPLLIKPLVKRTGSYIKYLLWVMFFMFLILFLTGFTKILVIATVLGALFFSSWHFFHPARQVLFQTFTPSKMRATISSLETMLYSIGTAISFPIAGFIADKIGVQNTIFAGSFILIPALIIVWKIKEESDS